MQIATQKHKACVNREQQTDWVNKHILNCGMCNVYTKIGDTKFQMILNILCK